VASPTPISNYFVAWRWTKRAARDQPAGIVAAEAEVQSAVAGQSAEACQSPVAITSPTARPLAILMLRSLAPNRLRRGSLSSIHFRDHHTRCVAAGLGSAKKTCTSVHLLSRANFLGAPKK
jgi:hypothetical protein